MTSISSTYAHYVYGVKNPMKIRKEETIVVADPEICAVEPICLDNTVNTLKALGVPSSQIYVIKDNSYVPKLLEQNKGIFWTPGGNLAQLLGPLIKLKDVIRKFVANGGAYHGACSAGMAAGQKVVREINGKEIILAEEDELLDLLPIETRYPVFPIEKTRSAGGDNGRVVKVLDEADETWDGYFNEGFKVKVLQQKPGQKIELCIGDFPGEPIAAFSGTFGKGRVAVTSIHSELKPSDVIKTEESKKSEGSDVKRMKFNKRMLKTLEAPLD